MKSLFLCLPLLLACGCSRGADTHAADNTARNARDRDGEKLTPTDQTENAADRLLTQKVRQGLMDDSTLSMNAQNIKVITVNGKVTLRGVVNSQEEKDSIASKVKALAGVLDCDNQLEVKAN